MFSFRCDSCPNPYAEVTLRGCEVVYDGCPKSYAGGLWWPRTKFGQVAIEHCPLGSQGMFYPAISLNIYSNFNKY